MKNQLYPAGSQLRYPDGSMFIYVQVASKLSANTLISFNASHKAVEYTGGDSLPGGLAIEDLVKDEWTFIKIAEGQPAPSTIVRP